MVILSILTVKIMNKYYLILLSLILLVGILILTADFLQAQTPPPVPSKPAQNPVDGGLAILAAAGGAYAIKKLRDKKK